MDFYQIDEAQAWSVLANNRHDIDRSHNFMLEKGLPDNTLLGGDGGGGECQVCFSDLCPDDAFSSALCLHTFCKTCYVGHVTSQIGDGHVAVPCMEPKCKAVLSRYDCHTLLDMEKKLKKRYDYLFVKELCNSSKRYRSCPAPDCEFVIKTTEISGTATCHCGTLFCIGCAKDAHDPANCSVAKVWLDLQVNEDHNNKTWISLNTKDCPKCNSPIQKNGGCNYICCGKCKFGFCWLCGQKDDHKSHSCGYYTSGEKAKKLETYQSNTPKSDLRRYAHYLKYYDAHRDSAKLDKELISKVSSVKGRSVSYVKREHLEKSVAVVCKARDVIRWSYVVAYNMKEDSTEIEIYQMNQNDLVQATERLSQEIGLTCERINKGEDLPYEEELVKAMSYLEKRVVVFMDYANVSESMEILL